MKKGKSKEYKRTMFDCIHSGLVEAFGIEEWDRFQRIIENDEDDFEVAPGKTDDFIIIELTIFSGRSKEQKKKAIELITAKLGEKL